MKIRPVGTESLHVDGRTAMTKKISAFRNFGNVPKKVIIIYPMPPQFLRERFFPEGSSVRPSGKINIQIRAWRHWWNDTAFKDPVRTAQ
jgi:hypothetical protein